MGQIVDAGSIELDTQNVVPASSVNLDVQVKPDTSWRYGKPSTTWGDFNTFFGKDVETEKIKAINALTYSQMLNISPSTAYKYHDNIYGQVQDRLNTEKSITENTGGLGEAFRSGIDTSIVGMMSRQKVPKPFESSSQVERWVQGFTTMAADLPFFLTGMVMGGGPESLAGWGGAFALPAGIRQMLTDKYSKGEVKDFPDFVNRTSNAIRETVKGEIVGGLTGIASRVTPIGYKAMSELATMTAASKLIEGQIPTAQDFVDNAAMIVALHAGVKGMESIKGIPDMRTRLIDMYNNTGIDPREVVAEIQNRIPADQLSNPKRKMVMDALDSVQKEAEIKAEQFKAKNVAEKPEEPPKPVKEQPEGKPDVNTVVDGLQNAYDKARNLWSGDKDVRSLDAMAEKAKLQDQLKSALGIEKYDKSAKDTESAIRVYLDMKIDPAKFNDNYDKFTDEQKRWIDLAKTIDSRPEIKAIADKVAISYATEGQRAKDAGKIGSLIEERFAARYWDLGDEKRLSNFFKTKTGHAEERTFPTLADGWLAGYNENVKGAFNGLEIYRNEISKVIANEEYKQTMLNTTDFDGNPLLSKEPMKGYDPIKHPQFIGTYAPKDIAKKLNDVLEPSWIREHEIPDTVLKYAMTAKAWILQTSLFHPRAFLNNFFLGGHPGDWGTFSPREAAQQGRDMIKELDPALVTLRKNGLTFGLISDWDESMLKQQTIVGDMIDKMGLGAVKDKVLELQKAQADWLFGSFGAGLKVFDAVHRFADEMKKYPDTDPDVLAQRVAEATNLNYGGLHLERMQRNKTLQDLFHLTVLAPDWTESNLRLTAKALKGVVTGSPEELAVYQKLVLGWAIKGLGFTALMNFAMAGGDPDEMMDNYEKAWNAGNLKWLQVDITPLYKMFGGETSNTKYYNLIGHMIDPVKALVTPFQFVRNKASVPSKLLLEAVTGADWQGKSFATVGELYDKGKLTRFGPGKAVNWDTFPAYVLSQTIGIQPIPLQNFINYKVGQTEGFDAIVNTLGVGVTTGYPQKRR